MNMCIRLMRAVADNCPSISCGRKHVIYLGCLVMFVVIMYYIIRGMLDPGAHFLHTSSSPPPTHPIIIGKVNDKNSTLMMIIHT